MEIPNDFPRAPTISSLSGAWPKVAVRLDLISGTYVSGPTDDELSERYEFCQDLAEQLVAKCKKNRSTKYAALSEVQIFERLLTQLLGTGWGTDAEMTWVIRRTATQLGWKIPEDATVLRTMLGETAWHP